MIEFIISNQELRRADRKTPATDSVDYLKARFSFLTDDWDNVTPVALFRNEKTGEVYRMTITDGQCAVPWEVLVDNHQGTVTPNRFWVTVVGINGTVRITTQAVRVDLSKSGYAEGTLPSDPTADVFAQYLARMAELADDAAKHADVASEHAEDAAQAVAECEDIKANIDNNCANAIKGTAHGEVIRVDDVCPIEHTVKAKVCGKNLIPFPYYEEGKTLNGITFSINDNGSIDITGVATNGTSFGLRDKGKENTLVLQQGVTYTFSIGHICSYTTIYAYITENNGTNRVVSSGADKISFVASSSGVASCWIVVCNGYDIANGITIYPQLEAGDTATEYEPYIDPTTVTVTRCGKNLFEKVNQTQEKNGITVATNADGSVTLNGTATDTVLLHYITAVQKKQLCAGKYAVGVGCKIPEKVALVLEHYNGGEWLGVIGRVTSTLHQNVDLSDRSGDLACYIKIESGATFQNLTLYPQLEKGETETEYEAYNGTTYTPNADGTVEFVTSLAPTMTLMTDTEGAVLDVTYNKDINTVAETLESTLDAIIAIQNTLIGEVTA